MITRKHLAATVAITLGALSVTATGCELITDFDRTKIDAGTVDATVGGGEGGTGDDGSTADVTNDTTGDDASDGAADTAPGDDASDAAADADGE